LKTSSEALILINGRIHTMNPAQPFVGALAIRDGKILCAGSDSAARDALPQAAGENIVDLKGACVLPGLIDSHIHMMLVSNNLVQVQAEQPTKQQVLDIVADFTSRSDPKGRPAGTWITGFGWNHNIWDGHFPTAADLDRVAPEHPVVLRAKSGHAAWANSLALRLAHITVETADPPGGRIVRDENGVPTGILLEEAAIGLVERLAPELTPEEAAGILSQGIQCAHRAGLTGVRDMDQIDCFRGLQVLRQTGRLTMRVVKSIPLSHLDEAIGAGLRTGFGDGWLRIGGVKMFADGALGPLTAWMVEGFDSAPDNHGISAVPPEDLREAVLKANAHGLAATVHAIGDRANREVLNIYAAAAQQVAADKLGETGLRNSIEHVQLIHPDDACRLAELGVIASMQPLHATSDMVIAEQHWGKRSAGGYALRTQQDCGAVLALGSDCPVETLEPLAGIHAAVTRRRADGAPGPEGWYPEQRLTVEEAVAGYTAGGAYAAGMEDQLGSLTPGKWADLTILDRDIFAIDPMEILSTRVLATLTAGRFVWRAESLT
jgi:predicted amidohydrolase YtcJ